MSEWLTLLVLALGRALLHFLWQGAVIGMLAAVLLHILRDARPQLRYAVACLAMLACALVPAIGIAWQLMQSGDAGVYAVAGSAAPPAPALVTAATGLSAWRIDDALPWIVALWASGACALSLRMAMGVWWIQRLCAAPQHAMQPDWQARLDALSVRFGLTRPVALRLVDSIVTPAAIGWLRPVVLLPTALLTRMPVGLIEALLAHELAHIRRHDYLVNLLQGAVEAMLFYHPVTWWLSRRIRIEREHIADELAADVIGDRRRLAVALSELSELTGCTASAQPTPATPSLVVAAQGGHLMSRIEQLVRPGYRRNGGRLAFPLIGLAAACLAFYAHAQINQGEPATGATVSNAERGARVRVHGDDRRDVPYALIGKGDKGYMMSGSTDDMEKIEAARRNYGSDFLWFRKNGQDYVVDDPATVARVRQAWAETEKLGSRMEVLGGEMEVHGKKMEALGKQMEQVSSQNTGAYETEMEALGARMETLGRQQAALATKQSKIGLAMLEADDEARTRLTREMDELSQQQDALSAQMDAQAKLMEAHGTRMEERMKPMEALGRRMDELGKPMDALGERMDALGEEMDVLSAKAEKETLQLIDDAVAKGLAKPAPAAR